jgi:hypothetical protein
MVDGLLINMVTASADAGSQPRSASGRAGCVMPFDGAFVRPEHPRRNGSDRMVLFAVKAKDLKAVIINAYLAGTLSRADVEDLFQEYGLHHD